MNLVYDVNKVLALAWGVLYLVANLTDVVHAVVAGRVNFDNVHGAATGDGLTRWAVAARTSLLWILTVYRLGKQLGDGCLARSSRAAK